MLTLLQHTIKPVFMTVFHFLKPVPRSRMHKDKLP